MIYEMVNSSLGSLANQWRDLSRAFQRLAAGLAENLPGDPRLQFVGEPDPQGPPVGLQLLCETEQQRIEAWQVAQQNLRPALALFQAATQVFTVSETARGNIENFFTGLFVQPPPAVSIEIAGGRNQLDQLRQFIARCLQDFEEITSPEGQRFSLSGIRDSAENIASYPLLTSDLGIVSPPTSSAPAAPAGTSLQRTVEGALRQVLGRLPKPKDPRSFVAALKQSFELVQVDGHTESRWTPRSYAGQTELGGGVTGAQASLYARAKVSLDNSVPLLDGLYPLLPDADQEEVEAIRAIVRSELRETVTELGTEGGPRVVRVDDLFESLLGPVPPPGNPLLLQSGHLVDLRDQFGLEQNRVNTLEEETNLTNFIVIRDYTISLRLSWTDFRTQFLGRDLGTRLVLLSRALSVAAESVNEVYAAMDSVFVGPAERQVASFQDANGRPILVEELLSWVVTFTSEEAPQLVYEGGRLGAGAIVQPAQRLEQLVAQFILSIPNEPSLPDGLRHPRVRHPLQELRGYLRQVHQLAQSVRRP
jgi:hypothetical protein